MIPGQPICDFLEAWKAAARETITLKDLLMMASGLNCNDGWEKNWAGVFEMMKSNDWVQYTLDLPMEKTPGEWFDYCNGVSHLLSAAISESTGMKTIEFAKKYLFDPLGIVDIQWNTDPGGTNIGFSKMWLQPKDMAKFGLLYLNKIFDLVYRQTKAYQF